MNFNKLITFNPQVFGSRAIVGTALRLSLTWYINNRIVHYYNIILCKRDMEVWVKGGDIFVWGGGAFYTDRCKKCKG